MTVKLVAWAEHIRDMGKYTVGDGVNGRGTLYGCEGIIDPPHNTIVLVRTITGKWKPNETIAWNVRHEYTTTPRKYSKLKVQTSTGPQGSRNKKRKYK